MSSDILPNQCDRQFIRGVVLYTNDTAVAFGDKLSALPVVA